MNSALLQLKIDPTLKAALEEIADYKGIPVSAWLKMVLKEMVRNEKRHIFTENGLTDDQELEVLQREKEAVQAYREGRTKPMTGHQLLKSLNA